MAASDALRQAAVREVLDAYQDLVEELGLCPWARPARRGGELRVHVEILADHAGAEAGIAALVSRLVEVTRAWDVDPGMRVGLLVVPDLPLSPPGWRAVRDAVGARAPRYVLADFHPESEGGGENADRLVGMLRRSPDPFLQLVPHAVMRAIDRPPYIPSPAEQAAILANPLGVPPPPVDPRERVALDNFATVQALGLAELEARLAALQALRRRRYAEVGLTLPASAEA